MAQVVNVLSLWKNTTFLSFSPHKYTELKITTQDHFLHIIIATQTSEWSFIYLPILQEYFVLAYSYGKSGNVPHFLVHISGLEVHMKNYHTASDG